MTVHRHEDGKEPACNLICRELSAISCTRRQGPEYTGHISCLLAPFRLSRAAFVYFSVPGVQRCVTEVTQACNIGVRSSFPPLEDYGYCGRKKCGELCQCSVFVLGGILKSGQPHWGTFNTNKHYVKSHSAENPTAINASLFETGCR